MKSASLINRIFTADKKEDKLILNNVINDSDPDFIRWAINAIMLWKNEKIPAPLWHIHGTKDIILPIRYTQPTHVIKNGSHMMVMNRADELNLLIRQALQSVTNESL